MISFVKRDPRLVCLYQDALRGSIKPLRPQRPYFIVSYRLEQAVWLMSPD
jgi:hypothetical protein